MATNAVVRARVDAGLRDEAAAIYAAMGLTVSDVFRMMLKKTVAERALPFDPLIPNEETIAAMMEARAGNLEVVALDELQAVLDADD
jgi:DNA-damage-inducible protein J